MKRLCLMMAIAASAQVPIQKVQIADGVYQFITDRDGYVPNGNSVVVVNANDVLVFDTFTRPSSAQAVLNEIRKMTSKPVRVVVNSHWHPDHWFGNQVYADAFPGVKIIATAQTRDFMLTTANTWKPRFSARLRDATSALEKGFLSEAIAVRHAFPTQLYTDRLTIERGDREFQFISMTGDAGGSTVMYLPKEKILVTGDVVSFPIPYYTPPLGEHAKSLRVLRDFDATVVIPGHGPAFRDRAYLNLQLRLFESILVQVRNAQIEGLVTVDEVEKTVKLDDLRNEFAHGDPALDAKFRNYAKGMIENAYRDLRDGKKFEY